MTTATLLHHALGHDHEKLYARYGLTSDEVNFIESIVKPMDAKE